MGRREILAIMDILTFRVEKEILGFFKWYRQ